MNGKVRPSFWRSGLAALAGLVLFVALMGLIPQPRLEGVPLVLVGILLALVPAALWLVFFYSQDRREPEPKRVILRVFFFGTVMAMGAGLLIIDDLFRVDEWSQISPWVRLGGLVLVVGFTQEFLKYVAVRYTVFPTPDFGDRVDGIIYGVTAGLGYATALNVEYVLSNQGVVLFVGSLRMVDTALAQASFAAVTGYFLAGAKHGARPVWWVPAGLTTAAALNGLVAFLRREVTVRGFTYQPLNAVLLAIAFVVVTLGVLFAILRRAEWRTLTGE
jgi:RsiW-degrading membrane proteinase PrsW (M82 family)